MKGCPTSLIIRKMQSSWYVFNSTLSRIEKSRRIWNDPKQCNSIVLVFWESWIQKPLREGMRTCLCHCSADQNEWQMLKHFCRTQRIKQSGLMFSINVWCWTFALSSRSSWWFEIDVTEPLKYGFCPLYPTDPALFPVPTDLPIAISSRFVVILIWMPLIILSSKLWLLLSSVLL